MISITRRSFLGPENCHCSRIIILTGVTVTDRACNRQSVALCFSVSMMAKPHTLYLLLVGAHVASALGAMYEAYTIEPAGFVVNTTEQTTHFMCSVNAGKNGHNAFRTDILFLKHDSSIFRQSSNPVYVCGFYMMEQVRLCAV